MVSKTATQNPASSVVEISEPGRAKNGRFSPTRDTIFTLGPKRVRITDHAGAPYRDRAHVDQVRALARSGDLVVIFGEQEYKAAGVLEFQPDNIVMLLFLPWFLVRVPYVVVNSDVEPHVWWLDLRCCEVRHAEG